MVKDSPYFIYIVGFAIAIGAFFFGHQLGETGALLASGSFYKRYGTKYKWFGIEIDGFIGASLPFGSVLGCFLMMKMGGLVGRKLPLFVGASIASVGVLFQTFQYASETLTFDPNSVDPTPDIPWMVMLGRFISGFGSGILATIVPVYLVEIAPIHLRGRLSNFNQLMITAGILFASVANSVIYATGDPENINNTITWRLMAGCQLISALVMIPILFFIQDSPVSLLSRHKENEALEALCWHRGGASKTSTAIKMEFDDLKASNNPGKDIGNASFSDLLEPSILRRLLLAVLLQTFQQWSGINAMISYSADILKVFAPEPPGKAIHLSIILCLVNFLSTFPAIAVIDKLGRRSLLIGGGAGMFLSYLLVTISSLCFGDSEPAKYVSLVGVYIFIFFFALSWGPVVWTVQSEIFPPRVRSMCAGIATAVNGFHSVLVTLLFPFMKTALEGKVYIIFVVLTFIMTLYAYFFVKETKGLSTMQINELFGDKGEKNATNEHEA